MLGIPRDSSVDSAKKTYRKLALKLHPDKNKAPGADEAFQKVMAAAAVLTDKEKKVQYDFNQTRPQQQSSRDPFGQYRAEDVFNQFFGSGAYDAYRRGEYGAYDFEDILGARMEHLRRQTPQQHRGDEHMENPRRQRQETQQPYSTPRNAPYGRPRQGPTEKDRKRAETLVRRSSREALMKMRIRDLNKLLWDLGAPCTGCVEKHDVVEKLLKVANPRKGKALLQVLRWILRVNGKILKQSCRGVRCGLKRLRKKRREKK